MNFKRYLNEAEWGFLEHIFKYVDLAKILSSKSWFILRREENWKCRRCFLDSLRIPLHYTIDTKYFIMTQCYSHLQPGTAKWK